MIHIHKRIRIVDSNGAELGRFNEKLLTLNSEQLHVQDQGDHFQVSLVTVPRNLFYMRPQPLDNAKDLEIYFTYKKGYKFSPHRYPPFKVKNTNLWLEPWKMDEHSIRVITGKSISSKFSLITMQVK